MTQPHRKIPIFDLLQRIGDAEQREEILGLTTRLGIESVEGLATNSEQFLRGFVPSETLRGLAAILAEYGTEFAEATEVQTPKYAILDQGASIVVNGVLVEVPTQPNALPKAEIITLYTLFGQGKSLAEVRQAMQNTRPGISASTVNQYLARANLVQQPEPQKRELEGVHGAPPPDPSYQQAKELLRLLI